MDTLGDKLPTTWELGMDVNQKIQVLVAMGSYLDGIDNVEERNWVGFNRPDKDRWPVVSGNFQGMAQILGKYRRQLVKAFGEEQYDAVFGDFVPERPLLTPTVKEFEVHWHLHGFVRRSSEYNQVLRAYGIYDGRIKVARMSEFDFDAFRAALSDLDIDVVDLPELPKVPDEPKETATLTTTVVHEAAPLVLFRLQGKTDNWNRFRDLQSQYGLTYMSDYGACVVAVSDMPTFDFSGFKSALGEIGIALQDLFELPKITDVTADALAKLDRKIGHDLFILRYIQDRKVFSFRWSFSYALNDLFSNKTGKLSGIMECKTNDWSRETKSIELAREALEKARATVPDWKFIVEDLTAMEHENAAKLEALRAPIPEVVSKLNPAFNLFPFQNEFVRFLSGNNGSALIGAEMGLGKTLISLSWCAANNKRALVICPKVVRRTWVEEAQRFFPTHFDNVLELRPDHLRKNGMPDLSKVKIATVNFASFSKFLPAIQKASFDVLIIDESHNIKNPHAQITETINSVATGFPHKILLSGTAIKNKKAELFTQLELVAPGLFKSFDDLRYATIGGTWNKIQDCYKTMSKHEVLKDLPAKLRSIAALEAKCPDLSSDMDIGDISRLKNQVAMAKAAKTVEFVQEILESSDSSVLVFSDSVDAAREIAEKLGNVALLHHGQMNDDAREAAKKEFQHGESGKRVFVSTRQSLAVGATLTKADKVVFNDLPWTPADVRQAEDRAHRIGQTKMVNVYWVKAEGNFWDENIVEILYRKMDLSKKVLEGKQLTEEERKFMDEPIDVADILAKFKREKRKAEKKAKNTKKVVS